MRHYSSTSFKSAARLLVLGLFALLMTGGSAVLASETTTLDVIDIDDQVGYAKVSVVYEDDATAVANGLTDSLGEFSFQSESGRDLKVTVHTETGYVGTATVSPGGTEEVAADVTASSIDSDTYNKSTITLTYEDASGNPIANADVSVVRWGTFAQVAEGETDSNGDFQFTVSNTDLDYLGTFWKDGEDDGLEVAETTETQFQHGVSNYPGF